MLKAKRAPPAPVWNQSFPSRRHCLSAAPSLSSRTLLSILEGVPLSATWGRGWSTHAAVCQSLTSADPIMYLFLWVMSYFHIMGPMASWHYHSMILAATFCSVASTQIRRQSRCSQPYRIHLPASDLFTLRTIDLRLAREISWSICSTCSDGFTALVFKIRAAAWLCGRSGKTRAVSAVA